MKREYGKKLIGRLLSGSDSTNPVDLVRVIDTSGAYIPGHGTPTVIIVGRRRSPTGGTVRAALGVRGEPRRPVNPAKGLVWTEIVDHIMDATYNGSYVTITDLDRKTLSSHPWSLSGGAAGDLKQALELTAIRKLESIAEHLGISAVTGEDSFYMLGEHGAARRLRIDTTRPLVEGDSVRDYEVRGAEQAIWPYDEGFAVIDIGEMTGSQLWFTAYRSAINRRKRFGTPMVERGLTWWEWQELYREKLRARADRRV
jgi:hypothetical protein